VRGQAAVRHIVYVVGALGMISGLQQISLLLAGALSRVLIAAFIIALLWVCFFLATASPGSL